MRNSHLVVLVAALFLVSAPLLATSFSLAPAAVVAVSTLALFALVARAPFGELLRREVEWPWLAACLAVALVLSIIGGQGHFIFAKDDWLYRDAVLADVAAQWLPVVYGEDAERWLLRAPLGMYLLPGAAGHFFGLRAAHLTQLLQNSLALAAVFYLTTLVWPRKRFVFVALFVIFSGLDVIPVLLKTGGASLLVNLSFWTDNWQYSSNVTQLVWSPNHTLPGWWFAALAALYLKREIDIAALAAASLPLVLWSPLTLVGAVALFVFFVACAPRVLLSWRFAGASICALGFAPILAYLVADAGEVPRRWLVSEAGFLDDYFIFILFALTQAGFLAFFRERIEPWFRGALFFSILLLLVIPVYSVGYMNDFSQRAPIVPRAMLAFGFDALLIDLLSSGPVFAALAGLTIATIGAVTPALEIYDAVSTRAFAASDCNLMSVHRKLHPKNYLSTYLARLSTLPGWMAPRAGDATALSAQERLCWPDRPYGEKLFNWLKPENRIWLRAPSAEEMVDPPARK